MSGEWIVLAVYILGLFGIVFVEALSAGDDAVDIVPLVPEHSPGDCLSGAVAPSKQERGDEQ